MDAPVNARQLLLETRTSTDGSVSPKPRWTKGSPPSLEGDEGDRIKVSDRTSRDSTTPVTTSPSSLSSGSDVEAPSPPASVRFMSGDTCGSGSGRAQASYVMAWRWLIEDEGDDEPKLQKPLGDHPDELPHLSEAERKELCRKTELRLLEVGRQWTDTSALIDEYLRFMSLRQRLDTMLTLDPPPLVDDVWQAHIACGSNYAAFCERIFGGECTEIGVPHKEIDLSEPIFYENTVGAYEHFFGVHPPGDLWPAPRLVDPASDADESSSTSGRRRALVRSTNERFRFFKDS